MRIFRRQPASKATEHFSGDAWVDVLVEGEEPSRIRVAMVRFAPGARNYWHAHAAGQTLYVTEGSGVVQRRGGEALEMRRGDVVRSDPGEWHWHGATPNDEMTHLAVWEGTGEGMETDWGEPVSDQDYQLAVVDLVR